MFSKSLSSASLIGCALTISLVTAAQAQEAATAAPSDTNSGMRVSVDPVTKEIRPVSAAESRALDRKSGIDASSLQRSKPVTLTSKTTGARGVRLGEEHMSSAVATRTADGKIQMECMEAGDHAGHAHAAPAAARKESNLE